MALPPLLLRGSLNLTNRTYGYTPHLSTNSPSLWTLAARDQPGSEVEVVLGLNRTAITAAPGSLLAGILSFTDSLGFTLVQAPVSARIDSFVVAAMGHGDASLPLSCIRAVCAWRSQLFPFRHSG